MSKPWPMVKLGKVLQRSEEVAAPAIGAEYSEVTVRLWGKGVVERGRVNGEKVSGRRFVARAGQFIASRIDARNGAMGLVPDGLDGALVSNDFPLFNIERSRLEPAFLDWLCRPRGFVELCLRASEGTTNRVRLKEDRFLGLEIPLPPLSQQRRIVARIEELAAKITEARSLRQQATEEAEALKASWLNTTFCDLTEDCIQELADVAEIIGGGSLPEHTSITESENKVLLVKVSDMNRSGNEIFMTDSASSLPKDSPLLKGFRILPVNSIVFPKRGGAIATNKKRLLRYPAVLDPNTMGVFPKDDTQLIPEFLFKWFTTVDLASMQGGTSVPQINKGDLAPLAIPVPSLPEQRRIVAELDALQEKVDALKRLQAETAAELAALLPSILDRAFKGEM